MKSVLPGLFALVFAVHSTGCYEWVEIRPAELPKLQQPRDTGSEGRTRNATLERPDGSLLEIGRNADARVTLAEREMEFTSPVRAELEGEALLIRAGNSGKTTVPLHDVKRVELSKLDVTSTVVSIVGPLVAGTLFAGALLYASSQGAL